MGSAVGFGSVSYRVDEKSVRGFFRETDTVVSDAQAQFTRVPLHFSNIAVAGFGKAVESCEDAHGGVAIDAAHLSACRSGKEDFLHASSDQRLGSSEERPNSATMSS